MKNILIACISLIQPNFDIGDDGKKRDDKKYTDGKIEVNALQTNEACVKFLMKKLSGSGEVLDKYFRVQSRDVAKPDHKDNISIKYLNNRIDSFCKAAKKCENIKKPDYKNFVLDETEENEHRFDNTLNSIAQEILQIAAEDSDIHIYLDVSGGKRDNALFIQLLTKLLSFYGYGIHAYYTDFGGAIVDMGLSFDHMKILDAVNEFVRRGSAASLRACFSGIESPTVRDLLLAMEDFENSIQLCDVNLYNNLTRVNTALNGMAQNITDSSNGLFIIRTMIPLIRQKFHISTNGREVSKPGIIRWCLENGLIQQALTIYNETVKTMIIEEGLIEISDYYNRISNQIMERERQSNLNSIKVNLIMGAIFDAMYSSASISNDRLRNIMDSYRERNPVRHTDRNGNIVYHSTERNIGSAYFSRDYIPYGIRVNIDYELCRKILTDCSFVSLIRNRVNHAASSAAYDSNVMRLLQRNDYHFSSLPERNAAAWDNLTPANIKKDMLRALDNLEAALNR